MFGESDRPDPEFIPVLGPLDDVVVAVLLQWYVARRVGDQEERRRWRGNGNGHALLTRLPLKAGRDASHSTAKVGDLAVEG